MSSTPIVRDEADRVLLADGRRLTIRPLRPDDAAALITAVKHEDPWDLRRRFMGAPPPPAMLARRLARADGIHDLALGAFADTDDSSASRNSTAPTTNRALKSPSKSRTTGNMRDSGRCC